MKHTRKLAIEINPGEMLVDIWGCIWKVVRVIGTTTEYGGHALEMLCTCVVGDSCFTTGMTHYFLYREDTVLTVWEASEIAPETK